MKRREFLRTSALASAAALARRAFARTGDGSDSPASPPAAGRAAEPKRFELEEATIASLQDAMRAGRLTARSITGMYLERIREIDQAGPAVNAVIEINPDAAAIAELLDRERKEKGPRGQLHGIPILIKDNIDTADRMTTTAGSLALAGSIPTRDSFVVRKLRD